VAEDLLRASGLPVLTGAAGRSSSEPGCRTPSSPAKSCGACRSPACSGHCRSTRPPGWTSWTPTSWRHHPAAARAPGSIIRLLPPVGRTAAAVTLGELGTIADRHYGRKRPIRLIPPAAWTPADAERYVRSGVQRRVFRSLRHYLPFLNMDVVYDNARLVRDLGPTAAAPQPVDGYFDDLLRLIPTKAAMREAAVP